MKNLLNHLQQCQYLSHQWQDIGILHIMLNRPDQRNAFNTALAKELVKLWEWLVKDGDACRVILLSGKGDKAFCAGADLKERNGLSQAEWEAQHQIFEAMGYGLIQCKIPVIALVNGAAFGGGMELLLACDMVLAADHAKFALPEVGLGIMPGLGATQTLARRMGAMRAKEMLLTGAPIDCARASEWGLINHVYPLKDLYDEGYKLAQKIAENAPLSVRAILHSVKQIDEVGLKKGLELELIAYNSLIHTKDRYEGIAAFNEKRKANFIGE